MPIMTNRLTEDSSENKKTPETSMKKRFLDGENSCRKLIQKCEHFRDGRDPGGYISHLGRFFYTQQV